MRTAIAIFLVVLILFNIMGFYGLLVGLSLKAKHEISKRLDNDQYHEEETITLKVPLSIPYYSGNGEYERVEGEIQHEGEFYRLVKQKMEHDTLYIVCIRDHKIKHIKQALADYVKTFTDKPVSKSKGKGQISFIKDYLPALFSLSDGVDGWNRTLSWCSEAISYQSRSVPFFGPPPKHNPSLNLSHSRATEPSVVNLLL